MEDRDIPEVGKKYIDMYEDSDTLGDVFICLSESLLWGNTVVYQMKHEKTGETGQFQSFDWVKTDE